MQRKKENKQHETEKTSLLSSKNPPEQFQVYNEIAVPKEMNIYVALQQRDLLRQSNSTGLGDVVYPGNIGFAKHRNGQIKFLSEGRHFFSPFGYKYKGQVSIEETLIEFGNVQIVTIPQGQIGLMDKNGEKIILESGRYILEAPAYLEKKVELNQQYVNLGIQHRVTVPTGQVAIAYQEGRVIILTAENSPYIINSPSFFFDPKNGYRDIKLQVVELEQLDVFTKDSYELRVKGLLTYCINDPEIAFNTVDDVDGSVKRLAETTLTQVFSGLAIAEIYSGLSLDKLTNKENTFPKSDGSVDIIIEGFLSRFLKETTRLGVDLRDLKIEKMEFRENEQMKILRKRVQEITEVMTAKQLNEIKNDMEIQKNEVQNKIKIQTNDMENIITVQKNKTQMEIDLQKNKLQNDINVQNNETQNKINIENNKIKNDLSVENNKVQNDLNIVNNETQNKIDLKNTQTESQKMEIIGEAKKNVGEILTQSPFAMEMFFAQNRVDIARAMGQNGNVIYTPNSLNMTITDKLNKSGFFKLKDNNDEVENIVPLLNKTIEKKM